MDLDTEKRPTLKLVDDPTTQSVYVYFKNANGFEEYAEIPYANVSIKCPAHQGSLKELFGTMFSGVKEKPTPASIAIANAPKGKVKAQASGPTDHVYGGLGAGKTND